jgi:hypothetical protein
MSWWESLLGKFRGGDVLDTPGKGLAGLKKGHFKIEQINSAVIYLHSGKSRIPLERKCFDTIEKAFQENARLHLFVAALHEKPALEGSADELIRKETGSELARGNYVCSMLQHCGLVQYKMKGTKKVIVLPGTP